MNPKDRPWTTEEEWRLRREFAHKTSAELAKEFKPGYVESPETKAKRRASLKRTLARKKVEARIQSHLKQL